MTVSAQTITEPASETIATTTPKVATTTPVKTLQEKINNPILWEIARCESGRRQYDSTGKVLQGKVNSNDKGIFQINTKYHLATARKLGIDIFTVDGNIEYARYLYSRNGTRDWNASRGCWASKISAGKNENVANLSIGSGGGESVRQLPVATSTLDILK